MKILLVEDDDLTREMLSMTLEVSGYSVVAAENGKVADKKIHEERFDLIVTDIFMPEREGIETIRAVKSLLPDIKVIAMSAGVDYGGLNTLQLATQIGADATLKKPFPPEALLDKIKELMDGKTP